MEIALILIGLGMAFFALLYVVSGLWHLGLIFYYICFASEKRIDRGYEKHILKKSKEYVDFGKKINDLMK